MTATKLRTDLLVTLLLWVGALEQKQLLKAGLADRWFHDLWWWVVTEIAATAFNTDLGGEAEDQAC